MRKRNIKTLKMIDLSTHKRENEYSTMGINV